MPVKVAGHSAGLPRAAGLFAQGCALSHWQLGQRWTSQTPWCALGISGYVAAFSREVYLLAGASSAATWATSAPPPSVHGRLVSRAACPQRQSADVPPNLQ